MECCVIVIPTYNERENIGALLAEILAMNLRADVLVVDDDSPDGTGTLVQEVATGNPHVHLLLRHEGRGRGRAGAAGFRQALAMGADFVVEMDADFSHHPRYLPAMLERIRECDVVVGSRFVPGGADMERGWLRRMISRAAGVYVRALLGISVRDVSSGFRCFRREVLESLDLDHMVSTGPSIVLEILYQVNLQRRRICEIPIIFTERRAGQSKLNFATLLRVLVMVPKLRLRMLVRGATGAGGKS